MTIGRTNLVAGPLTLYTGAFGATEPLDTAVSSAPGGAFTDAGATSGGAKLKIDQKFFELKADQIVDSAGRRLTDRDFSVKTSLAEPTLANLVFALNGGATSSGGSGATAYNAYDPADTAAATQPTYICVLMDGYGPNGKRRRIILRKCVNIDAVETEYKKDGQTLFSVEFACHWVSSSIKPWHIVDDNSP
jgi:hypothetical protein